MYDMIDAKALEGLSSRHPSLERSSLSIMYMIKA